MMLNAPLPSLSAVMESKKTWIGEYSFISLDATNLIWFRVSGPFPVACSNPSQRSFLDRSWNRHLNDVPIAVQDHFLSVNGSFQTYINGMGRILTLPVFFSDWKWSKVVQKWTVVSVAESFTWTSTFVSSSCLSSGSQMSSMVVVDIWFSENVESSGSVWLPATFGSPGSKFWREDELILKIITRRCSPLRSSSVQNIVLLLMGPFFSKVL